MLYRFLKYVFSSSSYVVELPKFSEPIINVTVPVGREAILVCVVDDLSTYKVRKRKKLTIYFIYRSIMGSTSYAHFINVDMIVGLLFLIFLETFYRNIS